MPEVSWIGTLVGVAKILVGEAVGAEVGEPEGESVGLVEGENVGESVGETVGENVGVSVTHSSSILSIPNPSSITKQHIVVKTSVSN